MSTQRARAKSSPCEQALATLVAGIVVVVVATKILGGFGADWRPSHFDEWRSLALAQRFVDSGVLAAEEPIGSPNGLARDISDRNRSLGFIVLFGAWIKLAPQPIAHFKALALAFLLLYMAGIYVLCRSLGIRPWAALPVILAVGALPTDAMLLGPALAAPSSLSLGLLCFALVAHLRLTNTSQTPAIPPTRSTAAWSAVLIGTAGVLAIVYPLTLIVFGGLVVIDVLARPQLLRSRYAVCLGTFGGLGVVLFLMNEWQGDADTTARHLTELILLDQRWHLSNLHLYRLDYLVLPPVLLLAFVGAGSSLYRDLQQDSERDRVWLALAFVAPFFAYLAYHDIGAGLVVPYQRIGLYLNFGAILCAAVACEFGLDAFEARGFPRWTSTLSVAALSLIIVFSPRASPPYDVAAKMHRPHPALEAAARRIAREYSPPARIFSAPTDGLYLEALTGLRVSPASMDALLTGSPPPVLDCNAGWEIVVGKTTCPNYVLDFRVDDVRVHVQAKGIARSQTSIP